MAADGARDPLARDGLEPSGVATGRVVLGVACVFGVLALGLVAMAGLYALRVASPPVARARAFPAPRLEVSIDPRATADASHGPAPFRRPPSARAAELARPSAELADAMAAEARRGASAYDAPTPSNGDRP